MYFSWANSNIRMHSYVCTSTLWGPGPGHLARRTGCTRGWHKLKYFLPTAVGSRKVGRAGVSLFFLISPFCIRPCSAVTVPSVHKRDAVTGLEASAVCSVTRLAMHKDGGRYFGPNYMYLCARVSYLSIIVPMEQNWLIYTATCDATEA